MALASVLVAARMPTLLMAAIAHRACLVDRNVNCDLACLLKYQVDREGLTFLEAFVKTH